MVEVITSDSGEVAIIGDGTIDLESEYWRVTVDIEGSDAWFEKRHKDDLEAAARYKDTCTADRIASLKHEIGLRESEIKLRKIIEIILVIFSLVSAGGLAGLTFAVIKNGLLL